MASVLAFDPSEKRVRPDEVNVRPRVVAEYIAPNVLYYTYCETEQVNEVSTKLVKMTLKSNV